MQRRVVVLKWINRSGVKLWATKPSVGLGLEGCSVVKLRHELKAIGNSLLEGVNDRSDSLRFAQKVGLIEGLQGGD